MEKTLDEQLSDLITDLNGYYDDGDTYSVLMTAKNIVKLIEDNKDEVDSI